jgi:hypothetical protein
MSLLQVTLGIPIPAREQRVVKINAKIYLNIATVCGLHNFWLCFTIHFVEVATLVLIEKSYED